jgi:hypothetical protein
MYSGENHIVQLSCRQIALLLDKTGSLIKRGKILPLTFGSEAEH